jgi:predicted phosphate transport protein (TIGR00153 family)
MAEEHSVIQDAEKHVEEICKTVAFLSDAVRAFVNGDLSAKSIAIENVRQSEHQADLLCAKLVNSVYEGIISPADRGDLIRFVKNLDKVANWTNNAGRLLSYIDQRLPEGIMKNVSTSTELIVDSVTELKEAIRAAGKNDFKVALQHCDEVDRLEHDADDQKRAMIESVISSKLEPTALLLSYNLAEALESVTDKVGAVSDFLRIMALKERV